MRSFTAALISCIIFFSLGEFISRTWFSHYGNALDISAPILEADQYLGWRQRVGLNTGFLNTTVQTNELGWRTHTLTGLPQGRTILVLGPSSAFGWGVEEHETYAAQLESLLQVDTSATVLNAGEIGYSSDQGVRMYAQQLVSELGSQIVVIAYGVNDLDRSRFYFQSDKTDVEEFAHPKSLQTVRTLNILNSSALVRALKRVTGVIRPSSVPLTTIDSNGPVPNVRVPVADFTKNIETLIEVARARGSQPILLTTITNLPNATHLGNAESVFLQGTTAWHQGDLTQARKMLEEAVTIDPTLCEAYYFLSAIASQEGDWSQAKVFFEKARAAESYRISADISIYNEVLKNIAEEKGVLLLDLEPLFAVPGRSDLFVDPIHFTKQGNELVARGLEHIIRNNALLE